MSDYGGFLFVFFDPSHRGKLVDRIQSRDYFTYGVSSGDFKPQEAELCLLSTDLESLTHLCFARKSRGAETGRITLKFSRFVSLKSIKAAELGEWPILQQLLSSIMQRPVSRLPKESWTQLIAAIKKLRPELSQDVNDLEQARSSVLIHNKDEAFETMAQERDATRIILEIAGVDKEDIRKTLEVKPSNEPAPFLKGLKAVKLREDPMIDHDARVPPFESPDLTDVLPFIHGSIEFTNRDQRITVLNVNRAGVEHAVGVDLVYYNHSFNSYVMVQYKRLQKRISDWVFDANNNQFIEDLQRMSCFEREEVAEKDETSPHAYRLDAGAFYFKFCKDVSFEPMNCDMIDGMYLPFHYVQSLLQSQLVDGPLGGKIIGYGNSLRHFNNSQFIGLVRGAWIGSRSNVTEAVTRLVRSSLEADRSVILGLEETVY